MAKRRTRAEMREACVGLLDIWKHVRASEIPSDKAAGCNIHKDTLPSCETLLERFDNRQFPASELLSGMQPALDEMATGLAGAMVHGEGTARSFLQFDKASSGRDFLEDMGNPAARLKSITTRVRLLEDDEFHSVKAAVDDTSDLLSDGELLRAGEMLGTYEFAGTR